MVWCKNIPFSTTTFSHYINNKTTQNLPSSGFSVRKTQKSLELKHTRLIQPLHDPGWGYCHLFFWCLHTISERLIHSFNTSELLIRTFKTTPSNHMELKWSYQALTIIEYFRISNIIIFSFLLTQEIWENPFELLKVNKFFFYKSRC